MRSLISSALLVLSAGQAQTTPADYPLCLTVNPGPVQPQVNFHPKHRLNGAAPVSDLA